MRAATEGTAYKAKCTITLFDIGMGKLEVFFKSKWQEEVSLAFHDVSNIS